MTLPFAAQFAVAPVAETIEMPAYNAETQMSEGFYVPECQFTSGFKNTSIGLTYPEGGGSRSDYTNDYYTDCEY